MPLAVTYYSGNATMMIYDDSVYSRDRLDQSDHAIQIINEGSFKRQLREKLAQEENSKAV